MYLGLDLGTGSLKAALIDPTAESRWVGDEPYEVRIEADRAEIDVQVWWHACIRVLSEAPRTLLEQVEAVGLSGQMHGIVPVDESNSPVRDAILWPDRRAAQEVDAFTELAQAHPDSLVNPVVPGMAGPMLLWMRSHEPAVWSSLRGVLAPKDWLRAQLTDEAQVVTDPSDASATLMYDVAADRWSEDVQDLLDLSPNSLSVVVASDSVAGRLSTSAGRELGMAPGIPVAVGAGDAAAALLGLGVETPGRVVLNVGTAAQVLGVVDGLRARYSDLRLHQYRTASPDAPWYVMAPVLNAGLALSWVRGILGLDWDALYGHADTALESPADPLFVPFLVGERDPDVGLDARGSWLDLTVSHDRSSLARSALLGVAAYLGRRTRTMLDATGGDRVTLSGGSSQHRGWAQLLATMIGCDVDLVVDGHASARGAAVIAARAVGRELEPAAISGRIRPDPSRSDAAHAALARLERALP